MTRTSTCDTCTDTSCSASDRKPDEKIEDYLDRRTLLSRMCRIRHKVLVLSGKGGVGKSTVAVNLATALAMRGKKIGLLDVDIHGPSIPKLLKLDGTPISGIENSLLPAEYRIIFSPQEGDAACTPMQKPEENPVIKVMSTGFLLRGRDDAVIFRGPRKYGVIRQFLKDVEWGDLDYLFIDFPPGTGDEALAVAELIRDADGAVVVTTPQEIAVQDVRRCVSFCRQVNVEVLGVVENMSGFTCCECGCINWIFDRDGGKRMAEEMNVPFLGSVPVEPEIRSGGDLGIPMVRDKPDSPAAKAFSLIIDNLDHIIQRKAPVQSTDNQPISCRGSREKGETEKSVKQ